MQVGITGAGIDATTTEPMASTSRSANAPGAPGTEVAVVFASTAFTGGEQINVTANGVGNVGGGTSHTAAAAELIEAGTGGGPMVLPSGASRRKTQMRLTTSA